MCRAASTSPQAWIMRTTMSASSGEKPRQVGFGPDDGERALVDGGALAQIGLRSQPWAVPKVCASCAAPRRASVSAAVSPGWRARAAVSAMRSRAAGSAVVAAMAIGWSRAQPSTMRPQPSCVPTMVSAAGARMRAALGAAGNVNRQRAVEQPGRGVADQRRERARRNFRRGANRRAGAGHHMAARIVAAGDEAEAFRVRRQASAPPRRSGR